MFKGLFVSFEWRLEMQRFCSDLDIKNSIRTINLCNWLFDQFHLCYLVLFIQLYTVKCKIFPETHKNVTKHTCFFHSSYVWVLYYHYAEQSAMIKFSCNQLLRSHLHLFQIIYVNSQLNQISMNNYQINLWIFLIGLDVYLFKKFPI